ncbi:hypothetical protein [Ferrimonas futtsuensis]|uniref:hypothetical protein n=1 Tax=Ferrimonas futtsuensis TaxID=364764 RepID=UPI001B7FE0F8|nr:hypothetical protein [Ferrimonas futtsuensis]
MIDTNVAIVANGNSPQATLDCELACVHLLGNCKSIHICLDESGLIMDEYEKHLNYSGTPGVGDAYFKYLYDYQYASGKIERVKINAIDDEQRSFNELPPNQLDPSDRKFLATAVAGEASIVNSTDSDWDEQKALTDGLEVTVNQLCPECCVR